MHSSKQASHCGGVTRSRCSFGSLSELVSGAEVLCHHGTLLFQGHPLHRLNVSVFVCGLTYVTVCVCENVYIPRISYLRV